MRFFAVALRSEDSGVGSFPQFLRGGSSLSNFSCRWSVSRGLFRKVEALLGSSLLLEESFVKIIKR